MHRCCNRAATDLGYECHVAHDACTTLDMEFNGVTVPRSSMYMPLSWLHLFLVVGNVATSVSSKAFFNKEASNFQSVHYKHKKAPIKEPSLSKPVTTEFGQ
ncbi:hypothetical protein O9929_11750 [Vibrio lentus]|nr:hypothetical protein [Vibrio lentus]